MKPIEEIGLLKMDFLGLRNLDVIESALDIIERSTGERPDMATLPPRRRQDVRHARARRLDRRVPVRVRRHARGAAQGPAHRFDDLVALVALYRPGAMRYIDTYARNKRNPESITYLDPRLRPITESTYSVILYQEQSMQIAKEVAGFSGPEADDLRKAIGKKDRARMASLKERFVEGARRTGTSEGVIQELWAVNEAAADYSFNRAHAACYALIAYRTAWLRATYPSEYMAALISSVMETKDKVPFFVSRCEEMGIEVLPPDVNESGHDFVVTAGRIRFGLVAVKGVGSAAVDAIIRARDAGGPFRSLWDFCERVDARAVNKKATESLVKCGALDGTGATRTGMLSVLEHAQAAGSKAQQDAQLGQGSIFDLGEDTPASGPSPFRQERPVPALADERQALGAMEKETLGLFLSSHPLKEVRAALRARVECSLRDLERKKDGDWVTVGGVIAEQKRIRTRKGEPMLFADPRRPGGPGRDAGLQLGLRRAGGQDRPRPRARRPRPRRPQGAGADQARRAGGRALRAHARGSRARRGGGGRARGRPSGGPAGTAGRPRVLPRRAEGRGAPLPGRPRAAARGRAARARARSGLPGVRHAGLPSRPSGPGGLSGGAGGGGRSGLSGAPRATTTTP